MPANLFDNAANVTFGIVDKTMGYDAVWFKEVGEEVEEVNGRVLFGTPSVQSEHSNAAYTPEMPWMEYLKGTFPGLYEDVRNGNFDNEIHIQLTGGNQIFYVRDVKLIHDGRTIKAQLEPDNEL